MSGREILPENYESSRYKSEDLKEKIADIGMWSLIPAVTAFLFNPDVIVTLEGDFLDKMAQSEKRSGLL